MSTRTAPNADTDTDTATVAPPGAADAAALPDLRGEILVLLPDLRAFARFLQRDRSAADDLVQDTVVRALAALGQFRPGTNLKAWLFTILRHVAYEQIRRRRREQALLSAHGPADEASPGPQDGAADLRDLQRTLWLLPAPLREALVLVGAQELTYEEAALVCDAPVGTIKVRVARARAKLAALLAGDARAGNARAGDARAGNEDGSGHREP